MPRKHCKNVKNKNPIKFYYSKSLRENISHVQGKYFTCSLGKQPIDNVWKAEALFQNTLKDGFAFITTKPRLQPPPLSSKDTDWSGHILTKPWRNVFQRDLPLFRPEISDAVPLPCKVKRRRTYLLKLKSNRSKTRTGPVLLRMVSGWPASRQKTPPAIAVPRKLSSTPCAHGREAVNSGWKPPNGMSGSVNLRLTCMFSVASPKRPPKVMALVTVPR